MSEEWYTTVEVARLLGRSDRFVRDRVKTGELAAVAKQNEKRASYKISREALMGFLLGSERKSVKEVAEVLKGMDSYYLKELDEAIMMELRNRSGSRIEVIPKIKSTLKAIMELERRNYPMALTFQDMRPYEKNYNNPLHFTATAMDWVSGRAEGHASLGVTTMEFFEEICRGEAKDDCQPAWEEGKGIPIIYFSGLVLEDPLWAPFLFKELARQLKEFTRRTKHELKLCFAVAAKEEVARLLERYSFAQVARYKDEYSVMLNRDVTVGRMGAYLR